MEALMPNVSLYGLSPDTLAAHPLQSLSTPDDRLDRSEIEIVIKRTGLRGQCARVFRKAVLYPYLSESELGRRFGCDARTIHGHLIRAVAKVKKWDGAGEVGELTLAIQMFPFVRVREILRGPGR
jgi:hypothetical protein